MTTADNNQRTQELLAQEGLESIGQKLFITIYNDLSGNPKTARRWIWELLQNAKDTISDKGIIEINLTDNDVSFSHNGSPFSHQHLLAILSQRSTKSPNSSDDQKQNFFDRLINGEIIDEAEAKEFLDTTGKFGTGFMTTYLLSKTIFLESIYSVNGIIKPFKISLDRKAETPDQMKEKVKQSFSSFTELEQSTVTIEPIVDYVEGSKCYTKFVYEFDEEGKTIAEFGVADFHNAIPYTLAFVEKLTVIKVIEFEKQIIYTRLPSKTFGKITIVKIEKESEIGKEIIEVAKISAVHESLTIAIPIENISSDKYKILFPNDNTPRQFISFPLIGSETFPFPVIINSPLFNLEDNTRSHVCLNLTNGKDFDKKVNLNRGIFQKAIELFKELLSFASASNWENLHFLAKSDLPKDLEGDWYKDSIQKEIRKEILDADVVVTENGKRIKPKDSKFPIYRKSKLEEFWELCKYLISDKIPRKQDIEIWKGIIEANTKDWLGADFDLDLEKLLQLVQNEITFKTFNDTYFQNEVKAFEALNKILHFTEDEDKELLNRKENPLLILPNQTTDSVFTDKKELSRDMKVPTPIKDVLKKIGDNWYEKLVRDEITVFERENKLTVKVSSDRIKDKIEKYSANKLKDDEKLQLSDGLFELIGYSTSINKTEIESLHKLAKLFFVEKVSLNVEVIFGAEEFDWKPCQLWIVRAILKKISDFVKLDNLSLYLFNINYPSHKKEYTEAENDLMFKVDSTLNDIIQFVVNFDKTLLTEFAIIPNQLNELCKFNNELFNDDSISKELKIIIKDFGADCRKGLLHSGVTITLNGSRDLKWICGQLDDLAIKEKENEDLKQPIRELDKWISKQKGSITGMEQLFKSFYRQRSGIVLNTYDMEERDQFDEILKSGMSADLASIVKAGTSAATIKQVADVLKEHPELTSEKIDQLLELEVLSKGWNPEMNYTPDEQQKLINFENGYKGEAFVYKELLKKDFSVEWRNKSQVDNGNSIVDFEGEVHFISERYDKYDLIAKHSNGKTFYIQAKATTTDISDADQIAMPISIKEWNFVFETKENDSYYLARVFNISAKPIVYFMKLEKPQELI